MAEISHSVKQHGGSFEESHPVLEHLVNSYCLEIPANWDANAILERARFYQAISTLRIARNGWVSRLDRMALVTKAMALLANLPAKRKSNFPNVIQSEDIRKPTFSIGFLCYYITAGKA